MFLQASVILSMGGEYLTRSPRDQVHPPGQGTPPRTRYTPDKVHLVLGGVPGPGGCTHLGPCTPPGPGTPLPSDQVHPPPDQVHPPWARYTPRHRACWEIRSTRGRYASYWNAFLLYCAFKQAQDSHFFPLKKFPAFSSISAIFPGPQNTILFHSLPPANGGTKVMFSVVSVILSVHREGGPEYRALAPVLPQEIFEVSSTYDFAVQCPAPPSTRGTIKLVLQVKLSILSNIIFPD